VNLPAQQGGAIQALDAQQVIGRLSSAGPIHST